MELLVKEKFSLGNKIFFTIIGLYSLFFIVGGVITPVFAHFHKYEIADTLYHIFYKSCMQEALRSFWIMGYQMAICARCFGAYIGFLISTIIALCGYRYSKNLFIIFAIIGFGEKIAEYTGFHGNNYIRVISACFLGSFLFIIPLLMIKIKKLWS